MSANVTRRRYRLRATPKRRCCRCWIRHNGRIIRFLTYTDYSPCAKNREPIEYKKRITHRRWPRGFHMSGMELDTTAKWLAELPADQWCQIVTDPPRSFGNGALTAGGGK